MAAPLEMQPVSFHILTVYYTPRDAACQKMELFLFWPFSAGGELNIACKRVFP
ncbi:hypothetical protein [Candidatus Electronema sp. JC]|uniref:hypothetical protein n=1 Tax=Candidatus Electronema sp. JC TaxID=3401570 RepID=UPI003B4295AB